MHICSITHNKNLNLLVNLLIRSAPQILSIKGDALFFLLNFLIMGLCNSSAKYSLEVISFLTVPLEAF